MIIPVEPEIVPEPTENPSLPVEQNPNPEEQPEPTPEPELLPETEPTLSAF
jgi:hypothetical protein